MRIIVSDTPRPLNLLALGPRGLVAAASSTFGVPGDVEVWDAPTGVRRFTHPLAGPAAALAFAPDGRSLFVGREGSIEVVSLGYGAIRTRGLGSHFPKFALSRDGTRMVLASPAEHYSEVFGYSVGPDGSPEQLWREGFISAYYFDTPAISPDGSLGAYAQRGITVVRQVVAVRDAASGTVQTTIRLDPASPVKQLAFTADGAKLLVVTDSRTVNIFDATAGAPAGELVHRGRSFVTAVAVHPRGPVACARTSGTVTLWDADRCEILRTLDWKAGRLVSVAFSPDGTLAAAGTEDGKIVVWDVDL